MITRVMRRIFLVLTFLLPLTAPAVTTQTAMPATMVKQATLAYDAGSVRVVSGNVLTGSEAYRQDGSPFAPIAGLVAAKKAGPLPAGEAPYQLKLFPDEAYNRVGHYGRTPTPQQRASVPAGMEFDHNPTLVQHYYEGANGSLPGFNLTRTERLQHAQSLSSGAAATPAAQRAQGAAAAAYSREQKLLWGLE
ncbi:MAG: hypothetical protein M9910_08985 [Kiritimatiellae bacterium]|nr:hypothetical protein [Kiritimatiellia bacterium]